MGFTIFAELVGVTCVGLKRCCSMAKGRASCTTEVGEERKSLGLGVEVSRERERPGLY